MNYEDIQKVQFSLKTNGVKKVAYDDLKALMVARKINASRQPKWEAKTVSGSIVSISDAIASSVIDLKANVTATQSGSGDPSPDNVRPIIGWDSVGLNVNGVITTINLGGTYYGGVLDVTSGVLRVNRAKKVFNGSESFTVNANYLKNDAVACYLAVNDIYPRVSASQQETQIGNRLDFKKSAIATTTGNVNCWAINQNLVYLNIGLDVLGITDISQETTSTARQKIKDWLANDNFEFTIPIEPFEVQLTPTEVSLILGNNTIFADSGDVEVTYKAKKGE